MGHNYTLTIRIDADGSSQNPIAGQNNQTKDAPSESNKNAKTIIKGLVSFNAFVKPLVQPMIDGYMQTVSLRTGSQEAQDRLQFAYNVGEQAVGIISTIAMGAIVGNLPGALLAAGTSIFGAAMNYANKAEKMRLEHNLESITLRGMNVRAGGYAPSYAGSRSRPQ